MMTCSMRRGNEAKRGVAIIIVLGLIAVLMMMAVAFSIHMRIERTGAANYKYGVQARHMIYAGLANAIRDIDDLMKSSPSGEPLMFPDWDLAASKGPSSNRASVLSLASAPYIPAPLQELARRQDAQWKPITIGSNDTARGRYAFVIINSSGLLDANRVGGDPRGGGTNCYEIQIDNLPDVKDVAQFLNNADSDGRYETFPELINVNGQLHNDDTITNSFSVFSLTPMKEQYDIGGPLPQPSRDRIYIGDDQSKWDIDKIIAGFTECGVPNPGLAYTNLREYVDSDSALSPAALASGAVERTPLINEFDFLNIVNFDSSGLVTLKPGFSAEWVYPFVVARKERFDLIYDIEVTPGANNSIAALVPLAMNGTWTKDNITAGNAYPMKYGSADKTISGGLSANTTNDSITIAFDVKVSGYIVGPDGTVDEVPSPYDKTKGFTMSFNADIAKGTTMTVLTNCWECVDPRFNWKASIPQWYPYSTLKNLTGYALSMRKQNTAATIFLDPASLGAPDKHDLDDDMYMHVADSPLSSLGELGYICYDWWRTIRLFEHQSLPTPYTEGEKFHRVLDKFTILSNDYQRGLVNINTKNLDVLASVFYRMPEEEYSTNRPVSWADAQTIARSITNNGPYVNISELGKREIDWGSLTTGPTEICRESGIRNAAGLLTTRDNLFTVIIRADSFSSAMGSDVGQGMSLATARAVAEIWRDPIPDEKSGKNKCLIRSFRFLED